MRNLRFLFVAVFMLSFQLSHANEGDKQLYAGEVVIEHAELIPEIDEKLSAKAIVTIWNGTNETVVLESITPELGTAELMSYFMFDANGNSPSFTSFPVYIPPSSEFVMKPNGIFLLVKTKRPLLSGQNFDLKVQLNKGIQKTIKAKILESGASPTHHHHGVGDS